LKLAIKLKINANLDFCQVRWPPRKLKNLEVLPERISAYEFTKLHPGLAHTRRSQRLPTLERFCCGVLPVRTVEREKARLTHICSPHSLLYMRGPGAAESPDLESHLRGIPVTREDRQMPSIWPCAACRRLRLGSDASACAPPEHRLGRRRDSGHNTCRSASSLGD
jgi:hypothetical protein